MFSPGLEGIRGESHRDKCLAMGHISRVSGSSRLPNACSSFLKALFKVREVSRAGSHFESFRVFPFNHGVFQFLKAPFKVREERRPRSRLASLEVFRLFSMLVGWSEQASKVR